MQEGSIIQRFSDRIEKVKQSICIPLQVAVFKSRKRHNGGFSNFGPSRSKNNGTVF
jgi:hypothetical protein